MTCVAGRYVVGSRLGRGSQGVVYQARDSRLNRTVALKFLPEQLADDAHARQRFIREAHAASLVSHRSICEIYSIESTDDGRLFIVMPCYQGQTLRDALHDGPLPTATAIEVAAQVAEGLAAAHLRGVVHRDIKPANLMLTNDGVRVLDFGLARTIDSARLTAEGSMLGTAKYMSPEQARCLSAGPRSDVWSLGVVLYEMLAGVPPFNGTHPDAVCYAIRHDAPPPLPGGRRGVLRPLRAIVDRLLRKDPRRRPTAMECARMLRELQAVRPAGSRVSSMAADAAAPDRDSRSSYVTGTTGAATVAAVPASLDVDLGELRPPMPA
jgi:serine/threonine-protein kinase